VSDKSQVQQPPRDAFIIRYTGREGLDWRRHQPGASFLTKAEGLGSAPGQVRCFFL
jgi:hypothetical protein